MVEDYLETPRKTMYQLEKEALEKNSAGLTSKEIYLRKKKLRKRRK